MNLGKEINWLSEHRQTVVTMHADLIDKIDTMIGRLWELERHLMGKLTPEELLDLRDMEDK